MYIAIDFPSMQKEEVFWNQTPPETGLSPPSTPKSTPGTKKLLHQINAIMKYAEVLS
jgi:hypothetical protein